MQGLQIFDDDGHKVLDTSTHTTSVLGSISIQKSGTYTIINDKLNLGTPFFLVSEHYSGVDISASVIGNKYIFTVMELDYGSYEPFRIIYGFY